MGASYSQELIWDVEWPSGVTCELFRSSFSEDVGDILFGKGRDRDTLDLIYLDNTLNGWLKKKWMIFGGKCCLL